MKQRKRYKIPKSVKTLSDLLDKDDFVAFVNEFVKRDLPRVKSLAIVFDIGDGYTSIATCGMNTRELHGIIAEALYITLAEDMAEDDDEEEEGQDNDKPGGSDG